MMKSSLKSSSGVSHSPIAGDRERVRRAAARRSRWRPRLRYSRCSLLECDVWRCPRGFGGVRWRALPLLPLAARLGPECRGGLPLADAALTALAALAAFGGRSLLGLP